MGDLRLPRVKTLLLPHPFARMQVSPTLTTSLAQMPANTLGTMKKIIKGAIVGSFKEVGVLERTHKK